MNKKIFSSASKVTEYFLTEKGRRLVMHATALSGGTAFGGYLYMHTVGLDTWREIIRYYKYGFLNPLPDNVIQMKNEVVEEFPYLDKKGATARYFTVYGFDVFHAGSTKLRAGALIGIPPNFAYVTTADIDKADVFVENKSVEWGSEDGELLLNSLVLSKAAQKFALAREIYMTTTNYVYLNASIHAASIAMYYGLSVTANDQFYGIQKPRSFRIFLYSLIGTFVFGVWSTSRDLFRKRYENQADEKAAAMGKQYAEGGVEFYAKILQRNIALRGLMGTNGERKYTAFGNDVEFIRQRHVPYTVRKDNLIKALSKYESSSTDKP